LYAEVFDDVAALDAAVDALAGRLAASNPDAMRELKRTFWAGTEDWDTLLLERAAVSGRLVLSDFTRQAIEAFKR
jgi:methylglutaconyl-CoA hydratase